MGGADGAGDFKAGESAEAEVDVVEMEADRETTELDLVDAELLDWLDRRVLTWPARLSIEAFLVCDGALFGMAGAGAVLGNAFWPGAVK